MDWIAIASGFGVGAIIGLTGVGGGSLMTPLLIGALKLDPAAAIGTDLWFAAITKSGGAWPICGMATSTTASPCCCLPAACPRLWRPPHGCMGRG
jgi:Sulfite exporter TauE/SafE